MWLTKIAVCALLVVAVTALNIEEQLEKDEIIEAVNSAKTTWTAGRNFDPKLKKDYVKHLMGWKKRVGKSLLPVLEQDPSTFVDLPKTFDARTQWKQCKALQTLRDQGPCGSCWAVAGAAAFTDRLCIASKYKFNSQLSAQDLLTCCDECGDGCNGGYIDAAWDYFQETGLVTGGDYKSKEGCQPYTLPACEHHVKGKRKDCSTYGDLPTPPCKSKCTNKKYKTPFAKDTHKVSASFQVSGVASIQQEIYKNGPLEAGFTVYEDFLSYKSGVYKHTSGSVAGGHAVKIIGWGTENGTPYWLVQNSWNSDWGDKGTFKILRGSDECGFEDEVYGGTPVV